MASFRQLENPPTKIFLFRLIRLGLAGQVAVAVLVFVPGTLHFWRGWAFMAVNLVVAIVFFTYYYRRDPEFLARRLLRKEKVGTQRFIMFWIQNLSVLAYVLCGLDNRFEWSRNYFLPVPWWLTVVALAGFAVCYLLFIPVFNANRFAASVIQVEGNQTVADQGPYRLVRHPMYAVSLILWFWIPLALGSFVVLPMFIPFALFLAWRLLNEEKVLKTELPGYADYCRRVRYRLIPSVW